MIHIEILHINNTLLVSLPFMPREKLAPKVINFTLYNQTHLTTSNGNHVHANLATFVMTKILVDSMM